MEHRQYIRMIRYLIVTLVLSIGVADSWAQGTRADYERAMGLRKAVANKVYKDGVRARWFGDGTRFWYRNDLPGGKRQFILVDAEAGTRREAFDRTQLAAALAEVSSGDVDAEKLDIDRLIFDPNVTSITFSFDGTWWTCDLNSYEVKAASAEEAPSASLQPARFPRPGRQRGEETSVTFINRLDEPIEVYWLQSGGGRRHYATVAPKRRHRQHTYAGHAWLVTEEGQDGEMIAVFTAEPEPGDAIIDEDTERQARRNRGRRGARPPRGDRRPQAAGQSPDEKWTVSVDEHNLVLTNVETEKKTVLTEDGTEANAYRGRVFWSPDSQKFVAMRREAGDDRQIHLIESSPDDQLQPKLHTLTYAKPGDKMPIDKPYLFDVATKEGRAIDDELFPNPWSISEVRWWPDSSQFTFLYNQRGHQVLRIVGVDAATGEPRTIVDETSETFVEYSGKKFSHYIDQTHEIIWMSERDGWNHLYLYDAAAGKVKNQITQGKWVVRRVENVDDEKRQIWFQAGGIVPGQDPYYIHHCRVNFDGTGLVILTEGDGTHDVDYSPDRRFFIDRWSRVDQPPVTELRRTDDGSLVCQLERADWDELLASGWKAPERFVAKARDGKTDIYGIIIRPTNFDPTKKYPVIEQIYAGPQGAFVPKSFGLQVRPHSIAELGFIVVQIDGMGTSYRSKAFHDVCCKNLVDAGFPDRILWMKAAAAKYPYMDLTRVGLYGGSAGGQNALGGLLTHGDFYKVGVADCGCHDNRMDKIWWNELWMGWPIGPHYEAQSNVTLAHNLTGKLMLTVGELDRNVDPASTMQVVNALIEADKDFDLIIIPGGGHGSGESPYAARRRMDFFVRHLLGVEPRCEP